MPAPRTQMLITALARRWMLAAPLLAALTAAACSSGTSSTTPSTPSSTRAASPSGAAPSGGTAIKTAHTSLGTVLTDGKGITVYLFEKDTGTKSACYSACAAAWPPVLTTSEPVAGPGARAALLGTVRRINGKTQVTYAGHPLYYFSASTKAGQVNGQGVNAFGAHWDAVRPSGGQAD